MKSSPLVIDANVIIDYQHTDIEVLRLAARHIAAIKVPMPILDEVEDFDEATCRDLGLEVVTPSMEILNLSYVHAKGALSPQDWTCFYMAAGEGWGCLTNDKHLRKHCLEKKVEVVRGLQLMLLLVHNGRLKRKEAEHIALAICQRNKKGVDAKVLNDFIAKLRAIK